jgi:HEAT repeat protein
VRAIAQAALRRNGADPAESYRLLAGQDPPAPGVIAGLGETGDNKDAGPIRRWLAHPRARGRVEAIRALRRLGATRPAELVPLLHDESGAVTRQVVATLRHDLGVLDPGMLETLLSVGNAPHVRFAGYRLLTGGDAWHRLTTNLRLIDDPDDRLRISARADIATWLDRQAPTTYHQPSRARGAELDKLIEHAHLILGERTVRLLRFHSGLPHPTAP